MYMYIHYMPHIQSLFLCSYHLYLYLHAIAEKKNRTRGKQTFANSTDFSFLFSRSLFISIYVDRRSQETQYVRFSVHVREIFYSHGRSEECLEVKETIVFPQHTGIVIIFFLILETELKKIVYLLVYFFSCLFILLEFLIDTKISPCLSLSFLYSFTHRFYNSLTWTSMYFLSKKVLFCFSKLLDVIRKNVVRPA